MNKTEIATTQNPLEEIEGNKQSLIFQTQDGLTRIQVELEEETVWLTQEQMSILFGKGRTTITEHIRNIFLEGELQESKVCRKFRHTTQHGAIDGLLQTRDVKFYNLDVIISVGYRVKSIRGTQFRQWANKVLKEYLLRGYTVNQRIIQLEDKIVGTHGSCVREPVAPARSLSRLLSLSKYCRRVVDRREKGPERNDNFLHLNF